MYRVVIAGDDDSATVVSDEGGEGKSALGRRQGGRPGRIAILSKQYDDDDAVPMMICYEQTRLPWRKLLECSD